jgi:hypothetical protein
MKTLERARRLYPFRALSIAPKSTVDLSTTVSLPPGYQPANPALVRYRDGYFACIRGVNYVYASSRKLVPTFTTGDSYHTINRFVLFDAELRVQRQLTALNMQLDNVEDIRLFAHAGRIYGIGTQPHEAGPGACSMCLLDFDDSLESAELTPLDSPYDLRREKNWCPFSVGAELGFLYACNPDVFLRLPQGARKPVAPTGRRLLSRKRLHFLDCGSTPAQPLDGEHLFITHRRSVQLPSLKRIYSSRLCLVSSDLQRVRHSPYFSINTPTIQFVSGIDLTPSEVLLAYGEMDNRALLSRFDRREFFSRLLPR